MFVPLSHAAEIIYFNHSSYWMLLKTLNIVCVCTLLHNYSRYLSVLFHNILEMTKHYTRFCKDVSTILLKMIH